MQAFIVERPAVGESSRAVGEQSDVANSEVEDYPEESANDERTKKGRNEGGYSNHSLVEEVRIINKNYFQLS